IKTEQPQLMIAFTCKVCDTRSSHTFSKQLYTKGSVLIQCPGCKNRHLIADNLKVFRDEKVNLEDLLRAKGESVAQSTDDLAFEDIPESLRQTLGRYANDAPEEYRPK
ncbi:zf-DNL-domain-containing protein, partial [Metschnikowia bicuspidata var. bicuspidata NRRL YB-4993]